MTPRLAVVGPDNPRHDLSALPKGERPELILRTVAIVPATDDSSVWESAMALATVVAEEARQRGSAATQLVITVGDVSLDPSWTVLALGAPAEGGDVNAWITDFDARLVSAVDDASQRAELLVTVGAEVALRASPWLTVLVTGEAPLPRWTYGARSVRDAVDVALADERTEYGRLLGALATAD